MCSPGEGKEKDKEKERKTTYEMARLHRERHEKGGVAGVYAESRRAVLKTGYCVLGRALVT